MVYLLYGPPGIGKSTIITELRKRGVLALDLEDLNGTKKDRDDLWARLNRLGRAPTSTMVVGAADHTPGDKIPNWTREILLTMPQEAYEERRNARDQQQPQKRNQAAHKMEDWERNFKWDYKVPVDEGLDEIVAHLLRLIS